MGQYYKAIILEEDCKKNEQPIIAFATPWDYDNGAKLMEHSYVGNHLTLQMEHELANQHYGKRFVWGGDYADENPIWKNKDGNDSNAYFMCVKLQDEKGYAIPPSDYDKLEYHKFVVNLDKKEFVRIPDRDNETLTIHPLPLLCADGNGRGGGDYHKEDVGYDFVGTWAFDHIGVTNEIPDGFTEITPDFKEVY